MIEAADRRFPNADAQLEAFAVSTVVRRYLRDAPIADFRLMVSPLVAWIWIGGVIVVGGTMLSLWPAPRRARRRTAVPAPAEALSPGILASGAGGGISERRA
jgi:cytochrome c-type biogenesis protein CcmF